MVCGLCVQNMSEAIPAFLTAMMMPFTFRYTN
jgi:xanthine/uracil/vitamin C permease (AzgA family)